MNQFPQHSTSEETMHNLNPALSAFKVFNPTPVARHRTIAAVLDTIAQSLNEGATVAPHSIDSSGLSIWVDGIALRLELTEEDQPAAAADDDAGPIPAEFYRANAEAFEAFMNQSDADQHDALNGHPAQEDEYGDDIAF